MNAVVLGACVGDAVGAQVEFVKKWPIPKELVADAVAMKGGGFLDVAPGQITDDGELTICLALALMSGKDPMQLYVKWLKSAPIDVGFATRCAISSGVADHVTQANGALMRVSPIPAFYYGVKTLAEIADLARADARRTHSSEVCQEANAVYAVALAHTMKHKNGKAAVEEAKKHTRCGVVLSWIEEAMRAGCEGGALILDGHTRENIGWVRWGLMLAFYHLCKGSTYEAAIIDVIGRGGDTDTNAAITGALMAALWGREGISKKWLRAVCKCEARPAWLRPSQFVEK